MSCPKPLRFLAVACALGWLGASPVWSQDGLDAAAALREFGGRYAADCGHPAATVLRIGAEALIVEHDGRRLVGRRPLGIRGVEADHVSADFRLALQGEVRGGPHLRFIVHADAGGPYVVLDGDEPVKAALGAALLAPNYRRCETGSMRADDVAPAAAVPPMRALIADPAFKRAYLRAVVDMAPQAGPAARRWLVRLDGPAAPTRMQVVDGEPYVVVAICKPHDCYDHSAVFLYSAAQARVVGLIVQNGRKAFAGAPSAALASQLGPLWQQEWRE